MVSPSGRSVLSDGRVACTQWAAQMQPARQGRWNGLTFRRRLSAAAQGRLMAYLDDVEAVVNIPPPGITPPVKLVLQANLPRLFAPDPPIDDFHALRLIDVFLASARDGARLDDPTVELDFRVAIR